MISNNLPSRWEHQEAGAALLLRHPSWGMFWERRLGKTRVIVETAAVLSVIKDIEVVVVACPAQVKDVWQDRDLGEIQKYCHVDHQVIDFKGPDRGSWVIGPELTFVVTSFEYLRQEDAYKEFPKVLRLAEALKDKKVWLVVDEMSCLGDWKSLQTKAVTRLRRYPFVKRFTGLDGTPAGNSTLCLYPKSELIQKGLLGYKNFWQFRANHAETVTDEIRVYSERARQVVVKKIIKVVGTKNLDSLTTKMAPHCQYLTQRDCLDLPEWVPTLLTVRLSGGTWKVYRSLRDDLVADLEGGKVQVAHAAARVLRLAQVCAGFVGGVGEDGSETRELSAETTQAYLDWLRDRIEEDPRFKTVVWCRWRLEIERLKTYLNSLGHQLLIGLWYGGEKSENFLHRDHPYKGAGVMIGQPQAGQYGIDFSKAGAVTCLSQDYNLITRTQAIDRVQADGVRATTLLTDFLVTGPDGQRTVTHDIVKALRDKEDVAKRTTDRWRQVLKEE